jgi:23S rRNA (cytosine1962-C5)-methyltransferase
MRARPLLELLDRCLNARAAFFDPAHQSAFRLFNGFIEGCPDLVIDLYASTVILTNYADPPEGGREWIVIAQALLQERLPWLRAGIVKSRNSQFPAEKKGRLLFGEGPVQAVREHGVWYAVNPVMHQDSGLYLDMRNLRSWAHDHLKAKTVLNAFAYTGSLGVAALAGGARRAVQLDRNQAFLDVAKASCALNEIPVRESDFVRADFFRQVARFRRGGERFDCVFLDPPFFSSSPSGVVDQVRQSARLINKVRPLVHDGGTLVAVNNALYVSGRDYMQTLEHLCADGYLAIQELIPVPEDFTGYPETHVDAPITDPAPFNHSTKIAVLEVRRKDANAHHFLSSMER